MESGALKHLIRTAAGCALFFGLVAPPLGGVLMFLLMAFGSGEWVGISLLDAGDLLGMAGFIGIFLMRSVFCRHVWRGLLPVSPIQAFANCGGFCCCVRWFPPLLPVC